MIIGLGLPLLLVMPFPFRKSQKSPAETVRTLKDNVAYLEQLDTGGTEKAVKVVEDISKNLTSMKEVLIGSGDKEPRTEAVVQLAQELYNTNLLVSLIENLHRIEFEGKKDVVHLFNNIVRQQIDTHTTVVEYISSHTQILFMLLNGYDNLEVALNCGMMLRECLRHEPLAKTVLLSEEFYNFFRYIDLPTFGVASDAFASFKDLLTRHKIMCAEFLENNYDRVFTEYKKLLHSDNYVTKCQSLKLLRELLLYRHNFTVMTKYINRAENLRLMMNMLRDNSRNIQFEAFQLFKFFVANPNKTQPVINILLKNQTQLVEFLSHFQKDRSKDEKFCKEKKYLIKQIQDLKKTPAPEEAPRS
ncbi:calcium-binding protein 39-like [Eucyclogobius newberryi]|uniref:calcium-binding protein 39-like n=1 Tax=Eucyclogobius newberryi TaxID=166745 RepID=UPI003B5BB1B3